MAKTLYVQKSFMDSNKDRYAIGDPFNTDSVSDRDIKHYKTHGMIGETKPVAPEITKPASPKITKPASPKKTK